MNEQEQQMEQCSHVWVYDHQYNDDVFLRCPRCGMVRLSMPGEIVARLSHPQKVKQFGDNDNDNY